MTRAAVSANRHNVTSTHTTLMVSTYTHSGWCSDNRKVTSQKHTFIHTRASVYQGVNADSSSWDSAYARLSSACGRVCKQRNTTSILTSLLKGQRWAICGSHFQLFVLKRHVDVRQSTLLVNDSRSERRRFSCETQLRRKQLQGSGGMCWSLLGIFQE